MNNPNSNDKKDIIQSTDSYEFGGLEKVDLDSMIEEDEEMYEEVVVAYTQY